MIDEKGINHEWTYDSKNELSPTEFLATLFSLIKDAEIVSVGEHHDDNQDTSHNWILNFEDEILTAAHHYQQYCSAYQPNKDTFKIFLPRDSQLVNRLDDIKTSFDDIRLLHVGRFFALQFLKLAYMSGFTDIVFEGINTSNFYANYKMSKDRIGDLLRLVCAMRLGMRIHGAYAGTRFPTPVDVGQALKEKIENVKENDPTARVIVYNGATHNMTVPYQGKFSLLPGLTIDVSKITYAPDLMRRYRSKYVSIDLLNKRRKLPASQFSQMQKEAQDGCVTAYEHGIRQTTFVID